MCLNLKIACSNSMKIKWLLTNQLILTEVWKKLIKIVSMVVYLIPKMHPNNRHKRNRNLKKILIMTVLIYKVKIKRMKRSVREELVIASLNSSRLPSLMLESQFLVCWRSHFVEILSILKTNRIVTAVKHHMSPALMYNSWSNQV
jgi:hypothetical protein